MKKIILSILLLTSQSVCLFGFENNVENEHLAYNIEMIARSVKTSQELQDAINDAAANATGETKITIQDTFVGNFVIPATNYPIILSGKGRHPTLDGGGTGTTLTLEVGATVELINIIITNGEAPSAGGILNNGRLKIIDTSIHHNIANEYNGGAIFNSSLGIIRLENSTITDNEAFVNGGGIYNEGEMKIKGSLVKGNLTDTSDGGGIYNSGSIFIDDTSLSHNQAQLSVTGLKNNIGASQGGALWNSGTMGVLHCSFKQNVATGPGGAIMNLGTMSIDNSTLKHNESVISYGGAIYNNGMMTIKDTLIKCNEAPEGNGGGIYNVDAYLTLTNCHVIANKALTGQGGGIYNLGNSPTISHLILKRTRVEKNKAVYGGGIANIEMGDLYLHRATIDENTASFGEGGGGGIYSPSNVPIVNYKSHIFGNHYDQIAP